MNRLLQYLKDPRYYQIVFLGSFLCYGIVELGWSPTFSKYIALFLSCVGTQIVLAYLFKKPQSQWPSAVITSLGLSLLLKTEQPIIAALAGCLAISSKFLLTYKGRHFMNPANFGLVLVVMGTQQAWISPGQWGATGFLFFIVGALGLIVSSKASSLRLALVFLGTLFSLQFFRSVVFLNWPIDFLIQSFNSGALLLFTFFMITDPVSTPQSKWGRNLFAVSVALLSFTMSNFYFINAAPVYALFIISALRPLVSKLSDVISTRANHVVIPKTSI